MTTTCRNSSEREAVILYNFDSFVSHTSIVSRGRNIRLDLSVLSLVEDRRLEMFESLAKVTNRSKSCSTRNCARNTYGRVRNSCCLRIQAAKPFVYYILGFTALLQDYQLYMWVRRRSSARVSAPLPSKTCVCDTLPPSLSTSSLCRLASTF